MKKLLLVAVLALAGCMDRPDKPTPPPAPYVGAKEKPALACKGEVKETSKYNLEVKCEDGSVFKYRSQKYPLERNGNFL